eukprot:Rmarinus@m.2730
MKVVSIQYAPNNCGKESNMRRVMRFISRLSADDEVALLVLPEMAFTPYEFPDKAAALDVLESKGCGPTYEWCLDVARRLNCIVVCGYGEVCRSEATESGASDGEPKYFNAAMVVSPEGLKASIAKHFLYSTDKQWAHAGPSFRTVNIPKLGKCCVAICMDINPYEFKAPWTDFELARFCLREKTDALIMCFAWKLSPETDETSETSLITYWVDRLQPLVEHFVNGEDSPDTPQQDGPKCFRFICSCRVGKDIETTYAGNSCILEFSPSGIRLVGLLDKTSESALEVQLPPIVRNLT